MQFNSFVNLIVLIKYLHGRLVVSSEDSQIKDMRSFMQVMLTKAASLILKAKVLIFYLTLFFLKVEVGVSLICGDNGFYAGCMFTVIRFWG